MIVMNMSEKKLPSILDVQVRCPSDVGPGVGPVRCRKQRISVQTWPTGDWDMSRLTVGQTRHLPASEGRGGGGAPQLDLSIKGRQLRVWPVACTAEAEVSDDMDQSEAPFLVYLLQASDLAALGVFTDSETDTGDSRLITEDDNTPRPGEGDIVD
ncbi:hypothetical protein RRG08_045450 [Elysia crispata]|uniref:Uncharacterized protein n=1 Tax=Elysia crispata TaxID=231223 RepID=A0AAE1AXC3_9GAST|nr:hypothetical protein RRG08_045450 [Elysia crispata]